MVQLFSSEPTDAPWQSCDENCWEALPDIVTGHIWQLWEYGKHYEGLLYRDPELLTVYTGIITGPDGDTVEMNVVFCYEETSALMMYCHLKDWCLTRETQILNWYCFPFVYLVSSDGQLGYKVTL